MTQRPAQRPAQKYRPRVPRVSVIVPTRNEARNLEVVLPAVAAVRPVVHEVLVVDGNSVDGTVETALRVLPEARIVMQTRKGKGNAMACGFAAATGDVLVMFDADGSADPQEIPRFVQALMDGADFAKGSRFVRGGGSDDITLLRKSGNYGLNGVANALFGTRYTDLCYGYNAFWADILPLLELPEVDAPPHPDGTMLWGDGFEIETVLNCRVAAAGLNIAEVPSMERERMFGQTNLRTFADGTRVLRTLAAERRRASRAGVATQQPVPSATEQRSVGVRTTPAAYADAPTLPPSAPVPPVLPEDTGGHQRVAANGQRPHRTETNGHRTADNGHRTPDNGQRTAENGHRPAPESSGSGAARGDSVGVRYAWGEEAS